MGARSPTKSLNRNEDEEGLGSANFSSPFSSSQSSSSARPSIRSESTHFGGDAYGGRFSTAKIVARMCLQKSRLARQRYSRSRFWGSSPGTSSILRGSRESPIAVRVPLPGGLALAPCLGAVPSDGLGSLGTNAPFGGSLAASRPRVSSRSPASYGRHHLRQDPSAVVPLAGIRGGGHGQP